MNKIGPRLYEFKNGKELWKLLYHLEEKGFEFKMIKLFSSSILDQGEKSGRHDHGMREMCV